MEKKTYTVYLRVTNNCNINCSHCYSNKSNDYMSIEILKKVADVFEGSHFIFHGGEPTIMPLDWFLNAVKILKGKFSIQTNLVNISNNFLDFFDQHRHLFNNSIGTSLDFYRIDYLDKILKNVEKLTNKNIKVGAIITIDDKYNAYDYMELVNSFIKVGGNSFKLQIVSPINKKQNITSIEKIKETFTLLLNHPRNRLQNDFSFCDIGIPVKTFGGNCAKRIRTVNPDGTIYICPEFAGQLIFPVGTLEDPIQNIENIKMFYYRNIKLSTECSPSCFSICEGGCLAMSYWIKNNINEKDPYCYLYEVLLKENNK